MDHLVPALNLCGVRPCGLGDPEELLDLRHGDILVAIRPLGKGAKVLAFLADTSLGLSRGI
ncbi:hypothetical protein GCM10012278_83290 [Nonomuraea glycinis]|uniref:Uncharacterized protein n=1 Tax=Nonomuraea glycinis TaxID=2047744 RepID=A0A918AEZ2_9ACTN|nr:hypothetical protein GCM10012278_83290 [Nonomuraea glycinis]